MAKGEGSGGDDERCIIGGVCAICVTVCFFIIGVPMLIAGAVMIVIFKDDWDFGDDDNIIMTVGIALVAVSSLFLILGIGISICICACGKKRRNNATTYTQQNAVIVHQSPGMQQYPAQQGYSLQQQSYPPQQPQGYTQPPQPSQGYYPPVSGGPPVAPPPYSESYPSAPPPDNMKY